MCWAKHDPAVATLSRGEMLYLELHKPSISNAFRTSTAVRQEAEVGSPEYGFVTVCPFRGALEEDNELIPYFHS
jgi:hypothetical protein